MGAGCCTVTLTNRHSHTRTHAHAHTHTCAHTHKHKEREREQDLYVFVSFFVFQISELNGWVLSTLEEGGLTLLPRFFDGWLEAKTYLLNVNSINVHINPTSTRYTPSNEVHYWLAPMMFLGNRVSCVTFTHAQK